jgi:hypothetical protein
MKRIAGSRQFLTLRALAAIVGVGLATSADAASGGQAAASLEERVSGAEHVVVATARSVTPSWRENEHGDRIIVSRVLLAVDETLKGGNRPTMWLDVEGGTLDGFTMRASSLPMLQEGERAIFFLDAGEGDVHTPHLRGQGILFLDDQDVIRGGSLNLSDIRTRIRGQGR